MVSEKSIFTGIIEGQIPADIVYQDEQCIAIRDIAPKAPIHILLIPKKPIVSLADLTQADAALMGHMMVKLKQIADQQGIGQHFVTKVHTGKHGGQEVFHLHIHLLGDPKHSV